MILLNMAGLARPARIAEKSSRVVSTDLSILPSASLRMSLITGAPWCLPGRGRAGGSRRSAGAHERANLLTPGSAEDVALGLEADDDHRQLVLGGERERRLVDHLEVAADGLVVGQGVE